MYSYRTSSGAVCLVTGQNSLRSGPS